MEYLNEMRAAELFANRSPVGADIDIPAPLDDFVIRMPPVLGIIPTLVNTVSLEVSPAKGIVSNQQIPYIDTEVMSFNHRGYNPVTTEGKITLESGYHAVGSAHNSAVTEYVRNKTRGRKVTPAVLDDIRAMTKMLVQGQDFQLRENFFNDENFLSENIRDMSGTPFDNPDTNIIEILEGVLAEKAVWGFNQVLIPSNVWRLIKRNPSILKDVKGNINASGPVTPKELGESLNVNIVVPSDDLYPNLKYQTVTHDNLSHLFHNDENAIIIYRRSNTPETLTQLSPQWGVATKIGGLVVRSGVVETGAIYSSSFVAMGVRAHSFQLLDPAMAVKLINTLA